MNDQLVRKPMRLIGIRSKRAAVALALRERAARRRQWEILERVNQELIAPDYDVRAVRSGMGTQGIR